MMFKRLRNRFLLLNLVILSVMMLISFTSIYLVMYNNVHQGINLELHKLSDFNQKPEAGRGQHQPEANSTQAAGEAGNTAPQAPSQAVRGGMEAPPERSVSFFVSTDTKWNITDYSSRFTMDEDFYKNAVNAVSSQKKDTGSFRLDGNNWAFIVNSTGSVYRIAFLDITSRQAILTNLIYTFLAAILVMLVFIYFISRFFANRSIKPVKEAFDKQKQFIADASHELKTPLAVINTNADVLLSFGEDTIHNQSKWIRYIKSESERMTKLTNDLLYLTQLDYSDSKAVFSRLDLSKAIENVILTMEGVIFEHQLKLHYEIEPGLNINGNSEQVSEIAMVLLDNAVKYSDANGSIDIGLRRRANEAVFSVTNTGPGIPEEHLANIFDRFYRTDKSRARKRDGYGLGLAIAKAIAEQHNGKIHVMSVVNDKTTFTVELPLA